MVRPAKSLSRRGKRKLRLSSTKVLIVGGDCDQLARKLAIENAKAKIFRPISTAKWIHDQWDKLVSEIEKGADLTEAKASHLKTLEENLRPKTKRLFEVKGCYSRREVVAQISRHWQRRGYKASKHTVERCWDKFNSVVLELRENSTSRS